ncbi:MAG: glycosyltransferase, partial [Desulfuromonadales bacterium]|nr:glycosyltransferase [Desulfuromonadales bacterium]
LGGDEHAGNYGEEIYADVSSHNDEYYAAFSTLIRSTFADAVNSFDDGSIDLLHIDGLHSYEAVKEDFTTWRSKLSDSAIVLFHDSAVRDQEDFGVWKFWEEISADYPSLHFEHSNGLGVLFVGKNQPPELAVLIDADGQGADRIKELFSHLGRRIELETDSLELQQNVSDYLKIVAQRDDSISQLLDQLSVKEQELQANITTRLEVQQVAQQQQQALAQLSAERDNALQQCEHLACEREIMLNSRSWRVTSPLRGFGEAVRNLRSGLRDLIYGRSGLSLAIRGVCKKIYHLLPLSVSCKASMRAWFYRQRAALVSPVEDAGELSSPLSEHTTLAMQSAPGQILLIERWVPQPDRDAGSVMIFNFFRVFRRLGYAVTFLPTDLTYDPEYTPALEALGVTCVHAPQVNSIDDYLAANGGSFDIILTCRPHYTEPLLPLFERCCPQAKIIYETHDLHYVREQRRAEIENKPELLKYVEQQKAQELGIAAAVDCNLVVSEQERQMLLEENPELSVEVIPVISEIFGCQSTYDERSDLLFIGGCEHSPNLDAVLFFVKEALPLIVQQIPQIRLHLVGSNPPAEVMALASEQVVVHGFVEDLTPLMNSTRISVNPLRFGAGVKGKIVTSMSYGVPCVGTTIAVEGMEIVDQQQALVADTPEELAAAVVRLYNDENLWSQLSEGGLNFVRERFSLDVAEKTFVSIFERLLPDVDKRAESTQSGLSLARVSNHEQYQQWDNAGELAQRQQIEAELTQPDAFTTEGFCFVCNQGVAFQSDWRQSLEQPDGEIDPNWREQMVCPLCSLNNRMRAAIHLTHLLGGLRPDSAICLTEQTTSLFTWFKQHYPNAEGVGNEELTQLNFADDSQEAILSFDLLEHIPDYVQAFRECLRCLQPGGSLLFSAPLDSRIDWALLDQLKSIGFSDAAGYLYWSQGYAYLGGQQVLFKAVK